jgi:formylmethanofuran dehydrogenase subunit C|tara:strand:+ start:388 stop:624 length:237 start_codon:yes stop_codon:yes gene_type:complete
MALPKLQKDSIGKVVILNRPVVNAIGQRFHAGMVMVVQNRDKKTGMATLRPLRGQICIHQDDVSFVGNKIDNGFDHSQ